MRFVPPSEHQVLVFLVQVALLLVVARLLGELCRRFGQPSVVGQLAAGVLLGPSVLGRLIPDLFDWLFPGTTVQTGMLFTVGWLGVLLLLVVTGFDTDLQLIAQLGKAAAWVTAGSLLVPFAFGLGGGYLAPDSLLGPEARRTVFALFLAAALTISSLPVIATIMSELRLLRRNFGQLTLAVGMANDVIGWVLLGLIAGLASSGELELGEFALTMLGLVAFLALAAALGQRVVDGVLHAMRRRDVGIGGWMTMAVAITLGMGAITQALGVEAVLGAFIAGILLGRSRYAKRELEEQLQIATTSVFAPVFFATAGLRVDLSSLGEGEVALWAVIVFLIASVSKFAGSLIGARLAGLANREGLALGTALNARGALEIVIATVGLSLGVLNDASYTIVVIMAIATSVMAPPLLRWIVHGWAGSPEEQARLRREEQMATNVLVKPGRVLLPSRGGPTSTYVASVLAAFLPAESPVTVMSVDGEQPHDLTSVAAALGDRNVERIHVPGDPEERVVSRAGLGYGLLAVGVERCADSADLPALARALVLRTPLPVLLVRPPGSTRRVAQIRNVLLPAAASVPARAALEVAVGIASGTGAQLHLLHVRNAPPPGPARRLLRATLRTPEREPPPVADPVGEHLLDVAEAAAVGAGVSCRRVVVGASSRGDAIVAAAGADGTDLLVLGVSAQDVGGRPFLGQTAEHVLRSSDVAVAIVVLGPH